MRIIIGDDEYYDKHKYAKERRLHTFLLGYFVMMIMYPNS